MVRLILSDLAGESRALVLSLGCQVREREEGQQGQGGGSGEKCGGLSRRDGLRSGSPFSDGFLFSIIITFIIFFALDCLSPCFILIHSDHVPSLNAKLRD